MGPHFDGEEYVSHSRHQQQEDTQNEFGRLRELLGFEQHKDDSQVRRNTEQCRGRCPPLILQVHCTKESDSRLVCPCTELKHAKPEKHLCESCVPRDGDTETEYRRPQEEAHRTPRPHPGTAP